MAEELMGDPTVEATTVSNAAEKVKYHKFTCEKTGTVETIELRIVKALASEPELGIFEDSSGKPGTLLGAIKHAKTILVENEWLAFTGFSVAVTASSVYWFGFVDSVTVEYKSLTGTAKNTRKGKTTKTTLTSSPEVEAEATPEKISLKVLGTVLISAVGTTKVKLADSLAMATLFGTVGTTKVKLADQLATASLSGATGATKVKLADSANTGQGIAAVGTTKVRFATSAEVGVGAAIKAKATSTLIFKTTAASSAFSGAAGISKLLFATHTALAPKAGAATRTIVSIGAKALTGTTAGVRVTTQVRLAASAATATGAALKAQANTTVSFHTSLGAQRVQLILAGLANPTEKAGISIPSEQAGLVNPSEKAGIDAG